MTRSLFEFSNSSSIFLVDTTSKVALIRSAYLDICSFDITLKRYLYGLQKAILLRSRNYLCTFIKPTKFIGIGFSQSMKY